MLRDFGGRQFAFIGSVSHDRDEVGSIREYSHVLPPGIRVNRHATGPFCKFNLPEAPATAGVYAITVGKELKYIGECQSLSARFGPAGYGEISERNCHRDGQSTNCKINALILKTIKMGGRVDVWFLRMARRESVERELLDSIDPPWNGLSPFLSAGNRRRGTEDDAMPTADDFRNALNDKFRNAQDEERRSIRIRSRDLHIELGGYPGPNHRMPVCCHVMRSEMNDGDRVISSPPRGAGASLVIEYQLPR
jgi:hypothetical protein